ncbi:FtsX-like permease family protein [Actinomadura alba]|uniref:FtsX-like permease family protein n=1 Tax=Actinomadura alba TaxID=406431 RepID=A0ABR7LRJ5_9ACTN|nr:FtsX-like permease family protein [Actinomadura alba]MBC6467465.1 FtsX-like permease family protein [Actinomadura alba]
MTTRTEPTPVAGERAEPPKRTAANGGLVARRAVVRWAWRLFRREWRQQTLVLALVTFTVAGVTCAVSLAYNVASSPTATFGSASQLLSFDGSDPEALRADITVARDSIGPIEVIEHLQVPLPGSVDPLDLRAQDPQGRFSRPMLRLRDGRLPAGTAEVALTDDAAAAFHARVGSALRLDGRDVRVVGLVENPHDLNDEFALAAPGTLGRPTSADVLARAGAQRFDDYRTAGDRPIAFQLRNRTTKSLAAAGVFGVATVALLLVSLVAAAGFAAVAHRRLRQIGMLAAIGATDRHLRLVLIANGAVIGVIASVTGTALGVLFWLVLAGRLEEPLAHRIDPFSLPYPLLGLSLLVAVATPAAAAWWPARAMARIPVTAALSARPPRPKAARRSIPVAGLCLAGGVASLALADQSNPLLIITGVIAIGAGILLISPPAVRVLAWAATRTPIAVRLPLRDLGRYQARAGAALAAISLALGVPIATVVASAAAEYTAEQGNLADTELLVRVGDAEPVAAERTPAELDRMRAAVDRYAATLDRPAVVPLDMAVDVSARPERSAGGGPGVRPVVELGTPAGNGWRSKAVYVVTPELARHFGLDLPAIRPDTDVLTVETGRVQFVNVAQRDLVPRVQPVRLPAYSSAPTSFITPNGMRRGGWTPVRVGWLIKSAQPITGAQITGARDMAAAAGLTVEARRDQSSLRTLRTAATAGGVVLALGVLAMTVGTIRGEAGGELRTLTAAGATSAMRRTLTAVTAGALATAGTVLGAAGAYLGLIGAYASDLSALGRMPLMELGITIVGVPLLATATGWLIAGREPPAIARRLLE